MSRRWICPDCGDGVLAPDRPRKNDVRRYCLVCSKRTGWLVERSAPALDRQRAEAKTKRVARTVRKREAEVERITGRRTVGGLDLLVEAKRFAKLPSLKPGLRRFPEIEFRRRMAPRSSGHCWYGSPARIVVTIGTDPNRALATLLHEMAHAAVGREGHSHRFWSTVRSAAREAWPDADFDFVTARDGWHTQQRIREGLEKNLAPDSTTDDRPE